MKMNMKCKILSVIFAAALLLNTGMAALAAEATPIADGTLYDIWVGGVQVGGVPDENGNITVIGDTITGTVTYAPSTGTLTLDGASITAATTPVDVDYGNTPLCGIYSRSALNLVLTSANTITASTTADSNGVMADAVNLTISGDGSLKINTCGYGIQALNLETNGVIIEISNSVYAVSLNAGGTIMDSTVSAVGSSWGISTTSGSFWINDSSVYAEGGQYSFHGSMDEVSVRLGSGAHVKAEGAIKIGLGVNSSHGGYLRTASDDMFAGKEGSLETGSGYFEFVGRQHCAFTTDSEAHTITCSCTGNLKLENASAPHLWNATTDGADCADCPANADASVTADTTTTYYLFIGNAVPVAEEAPGSILKLFDNEERITVRQGGFTLDPNGRSIAELKFVSGSSSIGIASQPGDTPAVTMETPGVFATPDGATLDPSWFTSGMTGYVVVKDGDALKLTVGITEEMVTLSSDSFTYTGQQQTPAVTVKWTDGNGASTDLTEGQHYAVGYKDSKGDWLFPTDAGTYTVVVTGMNSYVGEVEKTYTIHKVTSAITFNNYAPGKTYDGTALANPTADELTISGAQYSDVQFTWYKESVAEANKLTAAPLDAGTYYVVATIPESTNTSGSTAASEAITISSRTVNNPTVTLAQDSYEYTGSTITPTVTVRDGSTTLTKGKDYEVSYGNNTTVAGGGTVTITFKGNYSGNSVEKTFHITAAASTLTTVPTAVTGLIYTGEEQNLVNAGTASGGTVLYSLTENGTYSSAIPTGKDAGSYTVYYKVEGDANHNDMAVSSVQVTIGKADGSGTVGIQGWTYGETADTPTPESNTNGIGSVTYLYESTDGKGYSNGTAPTKAGSYRITATFAETANYNSCTASATFTIAKASLSMAAAPNAGAIEYGQALVSSSLTGGTVNSAVSGGAQNIPGTWSWTDNSIRPAATGDYMGKAIFTPTDRDNYNDLTGQDVTVNVTAASPSIVVTASPGAQIPGKAVGVTITVKNPHDETLSDAPAATLTYKIGDGTEQTFTGSFVIPKDTEAGTTITITATTAATANYAAGTGTATVIVTDCTHPGNKTLQYDTGFHWYICEECGAELDKTTHTEGTAATCTTLATCSVCGASYGSRDSDNHTGGTEVRGQIDATTTAEGYTGDTYCLGCGTKTATGTTIPKKDSGGSTGGGEATPVTVPVSGGESSIQVGASVSGRTAAIDDVDLSALNTVIDGDVTTGVVTIDFSVLEQEVDTVEIPAGVVGQIAAAAGDPDNDAESLEIVLSDGTSIELDAKALNEKTTQADGPGITISIRHTTDTGLTDSQQQAVGNRPAYDISLTSGEKDISSMDGNVTMHVPYELRPEEKAEGITVYRVDSDGSMERCETSYDSEKKRVSWKAGVLCVYMIGYGEPQESPGTGDDTPTAPAYVTYTVQKGDTLRAISKKYGCTIAEIVAANSGLIKNPDLIYPGWQLKIPQAGATGTGTETGTGTGTPDATLPDDKKTIVYVVQKGDTLRAISKKYGCTVAELIALNGERIDDPDLIFVGWELKIPQD